MATPHAPESRAERESAGVCFTFRPWGAPGLDAGAWDDGDDARECVEAALVPRPSAVMRGREEDEREADSEEREAARKERERERKKEEEKCSQGHVAPAK
jgi:hypothetical protein